MPRRPALLGWPACLRVPPAGSVQHVRQVHDVPKVSGPPSSSSRAPQTLFTRITPPDILANVQGWWMPQPISNPAIRYTRTRSPLVPCNQLFQVTAMLTMPSHIGTQALPQSKAKTKDKTEQELTKGLSRNQIVEEERVKSRPWRTLRRRLLAVPCTLAPAAGPQACLPPQSGLQMPHSRAWTPMLGLLWTPPGSQPLSQTS